MNPDDFEPHEHTYSEWEKEITLDGVEYLVIGEPTVERIPTRKDDGRDGALYVHAFESVEIYIAVDHPRGRMYDYDKPLGGDALYAWLEKYMEAVAKQACEEQQDKADREREEEMYR